MHYDTFDQERPPLSASWTLALEQEFEKPYFAALSNFIAAEAKSGKQIFPSAEDVFAALNHTPLQRVKVVILGQDPYHGEGQAQGLAFSVKPGCAIPPSLKNMYKALEKDIDFNVPQSGDLTPWAKQGVLLLNTVLTVEASCAASHRGKGWEHFTNAIIRLINASCDHVVFLLWGAHAAQKQALIDSTKHLILTAPHPSPLSAHRGFFDCKHFALANDMLKRWGKEPINWQL